MIENKIKSKNDFQIKFSNVIEESAELYKRTLTYGAVAVVIYVVVKYYIVSSVVQNFTGTDTLMLGLMSDIQGMTDVNEMKMYMEVFVKENAKALIINRLAIDLLMLLAFPMAGGFMLVCRDLELKGETSFASLFAGFKSEYWGKLIFLAIIYFVVSKIALLLFVFPAIYFWVVSILACPLIMFKGMGAVEAIRSSFELVFNKWFQFFGILIVATLITYLGYLFFYIGIVLTYPFLLTTIYILYKHAVGFDNEAINE